MAARRAAKRKKKGTTEALVAIAVVVVISLLSITQSPVGYMNELLNGKSFTLNEVVRLGGNQTNDYINRLRLPWPKDDDIDYDTDDGNDGNDGNDDDAAPRGSTGAIQPPPALDLHVSNTTSACLIWMDDLHRLVEWIAYHYYTFSMRTLIIFRDPYSTQDLQPLLKRWESLMEITLWHNLTDFARDERKKGLILQMEMKAERMPDGKARADLKHNIHKENQMEFYRGCSMHLKERNRTWAFYIDTDEVIALSSRTVPNASQRMAEPGSLLTALQRVQKYRVMNGTSQSEGPCITPQRTQYSAIESPDEHVRRGVPNFLDPYRFQTLRFRHPEKNILVGKAIADVSKLNFVGEPMAIHRLSQRQCRQAWGQQEDIFRINHYIGSLEAFLRPSDRRTELGDRGEKWKSISGKAAYSRGPPMGDEARSWIQGFVDHFGEQSSKVLLEGAGSPFNPDTALQRLELACGDNCVEPLSRDISLLYKIDQSLQETQ